MNTVEDNLEAFIGEEGFCKSVEGAYKFFNK